MNPLRRKLSRLLISSSRKGIDALEPDSPCMDVLKNVDMEKILTEDIGQICKAVSCNEITKIFSLVAWIKVVPGEKRQDIKQELKEIAEGIVARTERECGKLKIPDSCRHLLLNL